MSRCRVPIVITLALGLVLAGGCNKKEKEKTVAAEGTLFLEGTPLVGATVTLVPETDGTGAQASALTGDGGTFKFTTRNTGDGAEPARYKVVVVKAPGVDSKGGPPDIKDPAAYARIMAEYQKNQGSGQPPVKPSEVHANYNNAGLTPLRLEIPADGNKKIEITINKKGTI